MRSNGLKIILCSVITCGALAACAVAAQEAREARPRVSASRGEERGFTQPSQERELGFSQPGLIREVPVKDGDLVKVGDVLAVQDDLVERAALAKEEYLLQSDVQLRAAVANRDLAKVEMARQEQLKKDGAGSSTEYERARVELIISDLKIELAKEETETKRLEIDRIKAQLDRMKMISPVNGIVRKVEAGAGEIADPQKPSIMLVVNDPLKVVVNGLPTAIANTLQVDQTMQVRYTDEKEWREAKIINFDPVANSSSATQLLHLELPNPEGRRAGQWMIVKLPERLAAAPKD